MAKCMARAKHGRIELIIRKGEVGYKEFAKVLNVVEENGFMSWYGDVINTEGKEQSGLIITSKPICETCIMYKTCPAKGELCNDFVSCTDTNEN